MISERKGCIATNINRIAKENRTIYCDEQVNNNLFLSLVRLGIGNSFPQEVLLSNELEWEALKALADKQGLTAVVLDGLNHLPIVMDAMPKKVKLQWIGEVMLSYESRYIHYCRTIAELARFFNDYDIKMMVLKGYACSLDWPRPKHRPCGDIDIWLFGKQRIADELLAKEAGIKVDKSEHQHTIFFWNDFMVENHYDFVNVHHNKSNIELDSLLKELGQDDSCYTVIKGEKIYLPSPNLNALFLLRHAMAHFAATEITLRHLLDWAHFTQAHGKDVDWLWLLGVLDQFGMKDLFYIFNAICVQDLGFSAELFPGGEFNEKLKERVLQEILAPEIPNEKPKQFIKRVMWKFRRWRANGWKHKLCYNDSTWSAFWSGVWSHILKPGTI